jgi:hypothetical protein
LWRTSRVVADVWVSVVGVGDAASAKKKSKGGEMAGRRLVWARLSWSPRWRPGGGSFRRSRRSVACAPPCARRGAAFRIEHELLQLAMLGFLLVDETSAASAPKRAAVGGPPPPPPPPPHLRQRLVFGGGSDKALVLGEPPFRPNSEQSTKKFSFILLLFISRKHNNELTQMGQ